MTNPVCKTLGQLLKYHINIVKMIKSFLLLVLFQTSLSDDLIFKSCKIKAPDFDQCLTEAIQDAIEKLKDGYEPYQIPPIDPSVIAKATMEAGNGVVHFTQNYVNMTTYGYSNGTVTNAHMDFDTLIFTCDVFFPRTVVKSIYDINGRFMVLPVAGKGPCTITSTDILTNHKIQFEKIKKGSDIYFIPKAYTVKLHPKLLQFNYENLFDGNTQLGDNVNKLLNDEWKSVFDDVAENYEKIYADLALLCAGRIFAKIPANQLFLE